MRFEKHIQYSFNLLMFSIVVFCLFTEIGFITGFAFVLLLFYLFLRIVGNIFKVEKLKNKYPELFLDELARITVYLLYFSMFLIIIDS